MLQISRKALFEDCIEPVTQGRVSQYLPYIILEVVKIVAAKVFLEFLGRKFLHDINPDVSQSEIYETTVLAPLLEEFEFRTIILKGIHLFQILWNDDRKLTDDEWKTQQTIRIHLSALIFASAHLFNPHPNSASALMQFTWSYIGGKVYGYLYEKYQSLSVSIISHGFNNTLAIAGKVYPIEYTSLCIAGVIVHKIGAYTLAVTSIDQAVYSGLRQTLQYFNWR